MTGLCVNALVYWPINAYPVEWHCQCWTVWVRSFILNNDDRESLCGIPFISVKCHGSLSVDGGGGEWSYFGFEDDIWVHSVRRPHLTKPSNIPLAPLGSGNYMDTLHDRDRQAAPAREARLLSLPSIGHTLLGILQRGGESWWSGWWVSLGGRNTPLSLFLYLAPNSWHLLMDSPWPLAFHPSLRYTT